MQDGSFLQKVQIDGEDPVTVKGTWRFDAAESRINLTGSMLVLSSIGNLRQSWKTVPNGIVSSDVERHPSGILIGSAREYPYIKK